MAEGWHPVPESGGEASGTQSPGAVICSNRWAGGRGKRELSGSPNLGARFENCLAARKEDEVEPALGQRRACQF
ncbi:hypothetical protein B0T16DRAFT_421882 [Cercophora newfieldiana]|uniref:Uncharacterized protein n=1 Tax=Cercophora newfieldiana TaxID=92897 RepID=A0AA39XRL0_9PEZI|nr:hypothetical protein B0T16DRAFT_421882 [Cercophora newfieldiana]